MKIAILTPCWKREHITRLAFMGIDRIRKESGFTILPFAVISEKSMEALCEEFNIKYFYYKNDYLGEKKNFLLEKMLQFEWDYIMEIGSDDIVSTDLFSVYEDEFKMQTPYFGLRDIFIVDSRDGRCKKSKIDLFGAGRCVHRSVVIKCGVGKSIIEARDGFIVNNQVVKKGERASIDSDTAKQLVKAKICDYLGDGSFCFWDNKINRGLDTNSHLRMASHGYTYKIIELERPLVADIKSDVNIWSYDILKGKDCNISEVYELMGKKEIEYLKEIINAKGQQPKRVSYNGRRRKKAFAN